MLKVIWFIGSCFMISISLITSSFINGSTVQNEQIEGYKVAEKSNLENFLKLVAAKNSEEKYAALKTIEQNWKESFEPMLLEVLYFTQSKRQAEDMLEVLQKKTGKDFGHDYDQWFRWLWNKTPTYSDEYFTFKAKLHELIDPKFASYFKGRSNQAIIRLDEVRWGGVLQDGIPPLRNPKMQSALETTYLRDSATIFGIEINGDARAYPKQILAWHELFTDNVGGINVAGVYCTLCGTVILYKTEHDGTKHELGTSGFLYRSNKLMYDKATQSLWSTLEGEPVVGPLVGKGIKLEYLSVVTTTWGEWKERHPETKVLSLNTGYRRDYRKGMAYKDYFATDELMFTVPKIDQTLKNKDEILAIRLPELTDENLAISSRFLKNHPIYNGVIENVNFTVFTDTSGAHRVFKTENIKFDFYDGKIKALDKQGMEWTIHENALLAKNGSRLERLPSHNAFWFGYKAAFPNVTLIK